MATSVWQEDSHDAGVVADQAAEVAGSSEAHLRQMQLVRRFIAQLIGEQGGADLTDQEWSRLCAAEGESDSDETAIARVVMHAYGMGRTPGPSTPTEALPPPPSTAPQVPTAAHFVADQQPWPTTVKGPTQPLGPAVGPVAPVPAFETIPISFAGKAWPLLDAPASGPAPISPQMAPVALPSPVAPVPLPSPVSPEVAPLPLPSPVPSPFFQAPGTAPDLPVEPLVQPLQQSGPAPGVALAEAQLPPRRGRSRRRPQVMEDRRRERLLTIASWVRNIGAIILLFVAWQLWGTAITQHHTQSALGHQFAAKIHHAAVKPAPGFTLIPATTRIPDPPQGTVMAHLQIPAISLDQYVVSGTAEADLAKGPGHYLGTAMPGQAGNVAIAGHRTTHGAPFNRLAQLAIGDPIYLTTSSGQTLTYIVSAVPVAVSPSDVTVLNNFGDDRLTLTTCNPEYSAAQRLIVVAAYLPPGASHPVAIAKGTGKPYTLAPAETSGWNTTLLPLVAVEALALAGLGLAFRKLSKVYGRGARWLILGPVWLALLLALFETLTDFLPAAV